VSTADLAIVVNGITELALIGTIGGLFYTRRLLFAASPKPQASQQAGEPKAKQPPAEKTPAAEVPKIGAARGTG
jgi:hypothetical protein